jgi:hypothetical protein
LPKAAPRLPDRQARRPAGALSSPISRRILPPESRPAAEPRHDARRGAGLASALVAGLLGALVVVLAFGTAPLDPRATGWMLAGPLGPDPVQYLLGWTYFRDSPWTLPPGLNPAYGLEIGSSIFFADAIPLLAFAFKALRGVVEVPQYFGPWLLGCGVLQGLLAWRLLGLATGDPLARAAGAGLFVLQPMLLTRMGGHLALAGQWLLLAALLLALRDGRGPRQAGAWGLLSLLTSLVHAYLLPMVLGLWAADGLARALRRDRPRPSLQLPADLRARLCRGGRTGVVLDTQMTRSHGGLEVRGEVGAGIRKESPGELQHASRVAPPGVRHTGRITRFPVCIYLFHAPLRP